MHQQLWGYKVEDKLYLGVREQKRLNTAALCYILFVLSSAELLHISALVYRHIQGADNKVFL
jgi:hypothetical protein